MCQVYCPWSNQWISLLWHGSRPSLGLSPPAQKICKYFSLLAYNQQKLSDIRRILSRCRTPGHFQLAIVWRVLVSILYNIASLWPVIMASSRCINSITVKPHPLLMKVGCLLTSNLGGISDLWEERVEDAIPRGISFADKGNSVMIYGLETGAVWALNTRYVDRSFTWSKWH